MNEVSDDELLGLVLEENEDAKNALYERYSYIINIILKKYQVSAKVLGIDYNELKAEALYGFSSAIMNYKPNKEATLATFISVCVNRNISNLIKKYNTKKNKVLNDSLSLDYFYDGDLTLGDCLTKGDDPLDSLTDDETYNELLKQIKGELSTFEYTVFTFMIDNYDYNDIASLLKKTPKQIDNTIQRIKNKVKKLLKVVEISK